MNKLINWLDKNHEKGLYELMTNQFYTAVLGSIIYIFFEWIYKLYLIKDYNTEILFRSIFLVSIIAFYISDYYYIKGSKPYRKWHFCFDIGFLVCMLFSVKFLNIEALKENINDLPPINLEGIKLCYLIFLTLYFIWDCRELYANRNIIISRNYYIEVVSWEVMSIIALIFIYSENESAEKLFTIITISTIWFCFISYRKSNHQIEDQKPVIADNSETPPLP